MIIGSGSASNLDKSLLNSGHASDLIQEVVNLMYTEERTPKPINDDMHIHPALSEAVERAFGGYLNVNDYHELLKNEGYTE